MAKAIDHFTTLWTKCQRVWAHVHCTLVGYPHSVPPILPLPLPVAVAAFVPYTSASAKSSSQVAELHTSPHKGWERIPGPLGYLGRCCLRTQTLRVCTHAEVPVLLLACKDSGTGHKRCAG